MEMLHKGMDVKSVFEKLIQNNAGIILDAGVILDDFEERMNWLLHYPDLYFAAGIHPNIPKEEWPENFNRILKNQVDHPRVKAIGETGLDFYREHSQAQDQYTLLELHYELSRETGKPLIFHIRNAEDEMIEWLRNKEFGSENTGVLHCFPGRRELAEIALAKGFYISYAGNVTFKNAQIIRDSLDMIPLDRILIETDAPYLSPHPFRGKNNHPGMIGHTYDLIAQEKKIAVHDLIVSVESNLKRFLKID